MREESLRRFRAILSDTSVVIFDMLKDLFFSACFASEKLHGLLMLQLVGVPL